jgi:hypothetical protein
MSKAASTPDGTAALAELAPGKGNRRLHPQIIRTIVTAATLVFAGGAVQAQQLNRHQPSFSRIAIR